MKISVETLYDELSHPTGRRYFLNDLDVTSEVSEVIVGSRVIATLQVNHKLPHHAIWKVDC